MKFKPFQLLLPLFFLVMLMYCSSTSAQVKENFKMQSPSAFMENKGQIVDQNRSPRKDIRYLYTAKGFRLAILSQGMSWETERDIYFQRKSRNLPYQHPGQTNTLKAPYDSVVKDIQRVDISFIDANPNPLAVINGVSGFRQNWFTDYTGEKGITNIHSFSELTLKNVWNDIDIVFHAGEDQMEYDLVLNPGSNINDIKFQYLGQNNLALTDNKLIISTDVNDVTESIPSSYEKESGKELEVKYKLDNNLISFTASNLDNTKTLVIDPILKWGTYIGESIGTPKVATDVYGNVYYSVCANSSGMATKGAYKTKYIGTGDVTFARYDSLGMLKYCTYFGGPEWEYTWGINATKSGKIYITGATQSTSGIATKGAYQVKAGGGGYYDGYWAKFDSSGYLNYSTYFGGMYDDFGGGITTDDSENVFLAGSTNSPSNIATKGAYDTVGGYSRDIYWAKFDSSGKLHYCTYFGGSTANEDGGIIALDPSGNIYISGFTYSTTDIATKGAYQTTGGGTHTDVFLAKYNAAGQLLFGTYYGGNSDDGPTGIVTDNFANIYITGNTYSTKGIASKGAYQTTFAGGTYGGDGFLVKFDSSGKLKFSTYYGGSDDDLPSQIAINKINNTLYITGATGSTSGITTKNCYQSKNAGNWDAFLSCFNDTGNLIYGTYYGGPNEDYGEGVATDNSGNVYIAGYTWSDSGIATKGAYKSKRNAAGYIDGYLAKFGFCTTPASPILKDTSVICTQSVTLTATGSTGRYLWFNQPYGGKAIDTNSTMTINVNKTDTFYVSATNGTCSSKRDTVIVRNINVPHFNLHGDSIFCEGTTGIFSSISGNKYTYVWRSHHGNSISSIKNDSANVTFIKSGYDSITLKISDTNSCSDSSSIKIHINPIPKVVISRTGDTLKSLYAGNMMWFMDSVFTGDTTSKCLITKNGYYKLIISNTNSCSAYAGTYINDSLITGIVYSSKNSVIPNCKVYLIIYNPTDTTITYKKQTLTDSNGRYEMRCRDSLAYIAAYPDSSSYPMEIPCYHDSSVDFQGASVINVYPGNTKANVKTIHGTNTGGAGSIGGKVTICLLCKNGNGSPVENLKVILTDSANKPLSYQYTDKNGYFRFPGLSIGVYRVFVDRPKVNNGIAPTVVLNSSEPSIDSLKFTLYPTFLSLDKTTSIYDPIVNNQDVKITPNPTDRLLKVEIESIRSMKNSYSVYSMDGRKILEGNNVLIEGINHFSINVESLPSGIYILSTQNITGVQKTKFVKK